MTKTHAFFNAIQKATLIVLIFMVLVRCSEEELLPAMSESYDITPEKIESNESRPIQDTCIECAYIVPAGKKVIDGKELGLKPGSIIGLNAATKYGTLEFHNLVGTEEAPIIIRNFGGQVRIVADDKWHAIKTEKSKYFRITGGTVSGQYGIHVEGGEMGLKLDGLSTNFEVDHVEVANSGFAGIMAKTDPTCDDATIRGNFTMYDVSLHDNFIHDTGGEGFYVGNSFWDGMDRTCGKRLPHEIKGLKIYNNIVKNTGWEAIQVGCAIEGSEIYNNAIENYGTVNKQHQNNGIQIGIGTGGLVYNNLIKKGTGNGMIVLGTGDNIIYNNIIVDAGSNGVFCDERYTPGEGFKFVNNTIVNPAKDGIRLYAEKVPMNTIINNIIVNPGTYGSYRYSRTNDDAFVYLSSKNIRIKKSNNLFAKSVDEIKFVNPGNDNYRLQPNSPAVNFGKDISRFDIPHDFYESVRQRGYAVDIGASEY